MTTPDLTINYSHTGQRAMEYLTVRQLSRMHKEGLLIGGGVEFAISGDHTTRYSAEQQSFAQWPKLSQMERSILSAVDKWKDTDTEEGPTLRYLRKALWFIPGSSTSAVNKLLTKGLLREELTLTIGVVYRLA